MLCSSRSENTALYNDMAEVLFFYDFTKNNVVGW